MKERVSQRDKMSRVLDANPKAYSQASIESVLQKYTQKKENCQFVPIVKPVIPTSVIQCVISKRIASNMRRSLSRVFKIPVHYHVVDRNTGNAFPETGSVGHHDVRVTYTPDHTQYLCDFHNDGKYYTRSRRV